MYALFTGKAPKFHEGEELYFDLFFNIQTEEFRYWHRTQMASNPAWLSVHVVLKQRLAALLSGVKQGEPEKREYIMDYMENVSRLDKIRDYSYTVDKITGSEFGLEEVVQVFNRINSKGTPLRKADLALAHLCSIWPGARAEFREFQDRLRQQGHNVRFGIFLRCLVAVATGYSTLDGKYKRVSAEDFGRAWLKVQAAVSYLLTVLRQEAYVGDVNRDLPTSHVLIPIIVYLCKRDGRFESDVIKEKFIRWLYLACLWSRYSSSSETKLQQDVSHVFNSGDGDPVSQLEEAIMRERGRIDLEPSDIKHKTVDSAAGRLSMIVARSQSATDVHTGKPIYDKEMGRCNIVERGYVFSASLLEATEMNNAIDHKSVSELANRIYLADRPVSDNVPPVQYLRKALGDKRSVFREQAIPRDQRLWAVENVEEFLAKRRELLCMAINDYVASWLTAGSDKATRQTDIRELLRRRESETLEFKSSLRWDVRQGRVNRDLELNVLKTLAGFMNAEGGICLIGVNDSGGIVGLERDLGTVKKRDRDGYELAIRDLVAKGMGVLCSTDVSITFHGIDGKDICQVTVERSDLPVFVSRGNDDAFYVRNGNQTRRLSVKQLRNYARKRFGWR